METGSPPEYTRVDALDSVRSDVSQEPKAESTMLEAEVPQTFDAPRRRTRVWWILAFYIPLQVLPWVLTCIMNYRPLMASTYVDPTGGITTRDFENHEAWQVAVSVMNSIAAVLTIPVTSLILAEASVVWLQRESNAKRNISLAQFFDIADRGWTDFRTVWNEGIEANPANGYIFRAGVFMLFCAIIMPLQQVLVRTEEIQVITCNSVPYPAGQRSYKDCGASAYVENGNDAQLGRMNDLPLWNVQQQVKDRLASSSGDEPYPSRWSIERESSYSTAWDSMIDDNASLDFQFEEEGKIFNWISALRNGTTTGVLPQHAMRMNSSLFCEQINFDDVPNDCPGQRPFTPRFLFGDLADSESSTLTNFELRVCVPGNFIQSPWSNSRDAQTITEEIFLGMNITDTGPMRYDPAFGGGQGGGPFGLHCTANTTRGYFELGNAYNNFTPQPLLEKFPRDHEKLRFSDYDENQHPRVGSGFFVNDEDDEESPPYMRPTDDYDYTDEVFPSANMPWDHYSVNDSWSSSHYDSYFRAPGPLTISAAALFGNYSYFGESRRVSALNSSAAAITFCESSRVPLAANVDITLQSYISDFTCERIREGGSYADDAPDWTVARNTLEWFATFNDTNAASKILNQGMFYATDALLAQASRGQGIRYPRVVYTSDGRTTQKPHVTLPALIILSVLLTIEVVLLLRIAFYAWSTPAWTSTLKSLSVAQLANAMEKDTLPPAGCSDKERLKILRHMDGRVGVVVRSGGNEQEETRRLAHGGQEPILSSNTTKSRKSRLFSSSRRGAQKRDDQIALQRLRTDSEERGG